MSRPTLRKISGRRNLAADAKSVRLLVGGPPNSSSSPTPSNPRQNLTVVASVVQDSTTENVTSAEAEPSTSPYNGKPFGAPFPSIPKLVTLMEKAYERDDDEDFGSIGKSFASQVVDIVNRISSERINPDTEDFQFARSSLNTHLDIFNSSINRVRASSSPAHNEMYIAKEYAKMVGDSLKVLCNVAKPLPPLPTRKREGVFLEAMRDQILTETKKDLKRKGRDQEQSDRVGPKRARLDGAKAGLTIIPQDSSPSLSRPIFLPPVSPTTSQITLEGPRSEEIYNQRRTDLFFGEAKFPSFKHPAEGTEGVTLGKDGRFQAASLPALIRILTSKDGLLEPSFSHVLLGGFHLFVTSTEFLEELTKRFHTQPPSGMGQTEEWNIKLSNIHIRVLAIIYSWLDQHWQPDQDAPILPEIRTFVKKRTEKDIPRGVIGRLLTKIDEREMCSERELIEMQRWDLDLTSATTRTTRPEPTNFIFPSEFPKSSADGLVYIDTQDGREELARHLTLKMSSLFQKLDPSRVVQFWYREGESSREYHKFEKEPSVKDLAAISAYGESLTLWVISSIVGIGDLDLRVRRLSFWIDVASRCMAHLDYVTAHNIYVSLNSSPVVRLKKTVLMVPYSCKERFKKLANFFNDRGYTLFRQTFDSVLPSLPPTTPLLRDIIQVKARNHMRRTDADGRKLIFIDECKVTQQARRVLNKALLDYKFQRNRNFSRWLNGCMVEFSHSNGHKETIYDKLYQLSKECEARLPDFSNPWEFCSETADNPLNEWTRCFDFSRVAPLEGVATKNVFTSLKDFFPKKLRSF